MIVVWVVYKYIVGQNLQLILWLIAVILNLYVTTVFGVPRVTNFFFTPKSERRRASIDRKQHGPFGRAQVHPWHDCDWCKC